MSWKNKIRPPWRESLSDKAELWRGGLHGFERETFRLDASTGLPSAKAHEQLFGQAGQARQIDRFRGNEGQKSRLRKLLPYALTLDFSDQQIELVSPPHPYIAGAEADIALLLRFVAGELRSNSELLWAFSQPPLFGSESLAAIRLADFGTAVDAEYKEKYRKQLLLRYGKAKQSWTGVHYNFSFDLRLFDGVATCACETYVHLARNLWRNFWLLELLFGCTPSLHNFYVEQVLGHFAQGGLSLAAPPPYASSLHSHFGYGYRSSEQQLQYLDYSNPCAYWQSIEGIAQVKSSFFRSLGLANTHLIQDSRELYAPFRLKQLHAHGNECWHKEACLVDYLELRILDIDPLFKDGHHSGIYLPSIYLAHLLLLHSALLESPFLSRDELFQCAEREQYVISRGRKLPAELQQQAQMLLEELGELCSLLGFPEAYMDAVQSSQQALKEGLSRAAIFVDEFKMEQVALLEHSRNWTGFLWRG